MVVPLTEHAAPEFGTTEQPFTVHDTSPKLALTAPLSTPLGTVKLVVITTLFAVGELKFTTPA